MHRFPAETTAAFLTLGSEQQYGLFDRELAALCTRPVPSSLLRTLYTSSQDEAVRGVALRRLAELAPSEGRTAVMSEYAARCPACPPPRCFTSGIERCLRSSGSGSASSNAPRPTNTARARHNGFSGTALPGAAFGSRDSMLKTGARFQSQRRLPVSAHLGGYNQAAATQGLREASSRWPVEGEWTTLLDFVASLTWQTEIERAAIEALSGSNPNDVQRAARLLSRHGTPEAREPIGAPAGSVNHGVLLPQKSRPT